jgi:uncharacterized membrane protein YdbT with pleckstrin-like domain
MNKSYIESLLGDRETIVLAARQHWIVLARALLIEVITIVIIIAVAFGAAIALPDYSALITIVGFVVMTIPVATMTIDVLAWSNRQFIITNRRVIQLSGVFNKKVTDSNLEKVNDVKMEQTLFGRLFGYGDIQILTASELGVNRFDRIDDPIRFKTAMLNAKEAFDHEISDITPSFPRSIPDMIAQLDVLRKEGILTEEEFQQKKAELLSKL